MLFFVLLSERACAASATAVNLYVPLGQWNASQNKSECVNVCPGPSAGTAMVAFWGNAGSKYVEAREIGRSGHVPSGIDSFSQSRVSLVAAAVPLPMFFTSILAVIGRVRTGTRSGFSSLFLGTDWPADILQVSVSVIAKNRLLLPQSSRCMYAVLACYKR
jgi:hypothetical protein